jgi:glycosyltransferase involved in cell wall biosynthesis
MTRRILAGLQKAAHVCCDSRATCDEILARRLLPAERVSVVPLGLRPEFLEAPDRAAESAVDAMLGDGSSECIDLLHVGSTISRKRIDVLLEVFARLFTSERRLRLLRVGGPFSRDQEAHAERLGILERIRVLPFLSVAELAAVYRRCAFVLLPSEAEGFGLPVIEAMACGAPVLVSDLAVLHEVGGQEASYAPVADVEAWTCAAQVLLRERERSHEAWQRRRESCRRRGKSFTWLSTAERACTIYKKILAIDGEKLTNSEGEANSD